MTLKEIEEYFGVSYRTLMSWKSKESSKNKEIAEKRYMLFLLLTNLDKEYVEMVKKKIEEEEKNK